MKLLLKISIALVVLILVAVALLLVLVNPNDYKQEIQAQVKQSINRDLNIKGDIGWTFFPQLGFSSGEIELSNLDSFEKPHLIKINEASVGINLLPLLTGEISIGKLTLDGLELNLITDKNGVSNLDNMGSTETTTETVSEQPDTTSESSDLFDISKVELDGIEINNTIIEIQDYQSDSYQKVTINEIRLGKFSLNSETELSINTLVEVDDLKAKIELSTKVLVNNELDNITLNDLLLNIVATTDSLPNGELQSNLKANINYSLNSQTATVAGVDVNTVITGDNLPNKKVVTQLNSDITYQVDSQLASINNLKLMIDKLELGGKASVQTGSITKVRYDLVANQWNLNPYMSTTSSETGKSAEATSNETPTDQAEVEPDLSFLKSLDIDGTLKMAGVIVDKIKIGEINKHLIIKNGKAQIKPLTAVLYDGLLTFNGDVDESNGRNKYSISSKLKNVQIRPLLTDAAEVGMLSGTTNFNFTGKGQGLTTSKIKQGIAGKGNFELLDGELYGVNLSQELRAVKAKLKGKSAPTDDSIKKTDFASLTGNFNIAKGLVNNKKLLMLSPVVRLDGSGLVQIVKETLDYKLSITPLSKSTKDTDYLDLNGLTIPMLIKGSFTDPKITLDTDGALKEQLKLKTKALEKEAKAKLKSELKKQQDKLGADATEKLEKGLGDSLKSFF